MRGLGNGHRKGFPLAFVVAFMRLGEVLLHFGSKVVRARVITADWAGNWLLWNFEA